MDKIIQQLVDLGPVSVIMVIVLVITLVPLAIESWKKLLKSLGLITKQSVEESEREREFNELKEKVDQYQEGINEKQEIYHEQSIEIRSGLLENQEKLENNQQILKDDIKELRDILQNYITTDNERTIATLRTSLWRMHRDFIEQGFITPDALKTWNEMGKVYKSAGGNDIFHEKLDPEVLALEIHYPDGSVYKQ